ncbi:hypothetical protein OAL04_04130 [Nitrospinae bacterium]|nr:hypothetical protein [Nitrospinota bacterium]
MVKKKTTPPEDIPFSDSKIKEALEKAADSFKERSSSYNDISEDFKSTETFLRNTGLKELFSYDFGRLRGGDGPPPFFNNGNKQDAESELEFYFELEALEWRFEDKSKKFRLMVARYLLRRVKHPETLQEDLDGRETERYYWIKETRPIIESPIETRIFYHPRLPKFIETFSSLLEKLKEEGNDYYPSIFCHWSESSYHHRTDSVKLYVPERINDEEHWRGTEFFGGNGCQITPVNGC